tara:strand:+ start:428 stop:766 length:339 start_codon:yes stop_codon:yes gene_type:complete
MRITKKELKRIIKEEYQKILKEYDVNYVGAYYESILEMASDAYDEGIRKVGDFVNYVYENSARDMGYSKTEIRKACASAWKAEKADRRPDRRMYRGGRRESFYDQPGWGRFD